MKREFVACWMFLLTVSGISQVEYFNNAMSSPGVQEFYKDVIVKDSIYVLTGGYATDSTLLVVRTLDVQGELLSSQTVTPTHEGFYWAPSGFNIHEPVMDQYYICSGADIGSGQQGFVMKLDSDFDTLWTKYYDLDPDGTSFFNVGLVHDNHLILVGEFANFTGGDYSNRMRIVKLDLDGNLIWNKVVDDPLQWELNLPRHIELAENGYLIGAARLWFNGEETEVTTHVRMTDFEGEVDWEFDEVFNPDFVGSGASGLLNHNGDRIFAATTLAHTETAPGTEVYYVDLVLRELDLTTGVQLEEWQIAPAVDLAYHIVDGIVSTEDGQMVILLGNLLNNDTRPYLMKVDTLGNVLWEQEYTHDPDQDWWRETLVDIKNTSDGGFVMAGGLVPADAPSERWSWVLKVDGCGDVEWQDCELVGVEELGPSTGSGSNILVYPNPLVDQLTIQLLEPESGMSYQVIDPLGRVVHASFLAIETTSVDLSHLAASSYWIRVMDVDGRPRLSMPLIKE